MNDGGAGVSGGKGDERGAQIEEIIADVVRRRRAGETVNDSEIESKHPHLAPRLGQRLKLLRAVEAAAEAARRRVSSAGTGGPAAGPLPEDVAFLREALSGYEILERLQCGGQGAVYRAIQRSTHRMVAIKVLLHGPLATERQRLRFAREVDLISRLSHPNIVTLFDSGIVHGRYFFAMEFIDGWPIDDYVTLNDLSIPERIRLFITICRAVSFAHQKGIIHRDLKPTNLLVDGEGAPHVLDFGLAKDVTDWGQDDFSVSITGQVVGTLPYLSPEQVEGKDDEVDVRSDIYSLGVVLYEVLSGEFPYPVRGSREVVRRNIVEHDPIPFDRLPREPSDEDQPPRRPIDPDLEAVVRKALDKDRARRYQSAAALADDLERYLAGEAVEAKADSGFYLFRKTVRKYRVQLGVAAAFLVLLTASAALTTVLWLAARAERDTAREAARVAHSAFDYVLNEIETSVRPLAGGTEVRDRLVGHVSDKLVDLQRLVATDAAMRGLTASLHEKQGDLAAAEGRRDEAAGQYRRFLAIQSTAGAGDVEAGAATARGLRKLAAVSEDPGAAYRGAIEYSARLLAERPDRADVAFELCSARVEWAGRLYQSGDYARGLAETTAALTLLVDRAIEGDDAWMRVAAQAFRSDGLFRFKMGDGPRGLTAHRRSLALHEALSARHPADAELLCELVVALGYTGDLMCDQGAAEAGVGLLKRAVESGEYLVRADPAVARWRRELAWAHHKLGAALHQSGRVNEAETHCDRAFALLADAGDVETDIRLWLRPLSYCYSLHARIHEARKNYEAAMADFEAAAGILEEMLIAGAADPLVRAELAIKYDGIARCCQKLKRMNEGLAAVWRAAQLRSELHAQHPDVNEWKVMNILSTMHLAAWHLGQRTAADDRAAVGLLDFVEPRLLSQCDAGLFTGRDWKYEQWLDAIEKNRALISRRALRRIREGLPPESETPGRASSFSRFNELTTSKPNRFIVRSPRFSRV